MDFLTNTSTHESGQRKMRNYIQGAAESGLVKELRNTSTLQDCKEVFSSYCSFPRSGIANSLLKANETFPWSESEFYSKTDKVCAVN